MLKKVSFLPHMPLDYITPYCRTIFTTTGVDSTSFFLYIEIVHRSIHITSKVLLWSTCPPKPSSSLVPREVRRNHLHAQERKATETNKTPIATIQASVFPLQNTSSPHRKPTMSSSSPAASNPSRSSSKNMASKSRWSMAIWQTSRSQTRPLI